MRISKRPEERRQELVDAAQALFSEQGVEATSVGQIVRRVGVAQGLYYYYFRSKEEMVEAVADRLIGRFEQRLDRELAAAGQGFRRRLDALLTGCFNAYGELCGSRCWTDPTVRGSRIARRIGDRVKAAVSERLLAVIRDGIARGETALPYPERTARIVVSGVGDLLFAGDEDPAAVRAVMERMLGVPSSADQAARQDEGEAR